MNLTTELAAARTRLGLGLMAVVGALALVVVLSAGQAQASTGGVGTASPASASDDSAPSGSANKARYERLWDRVSNGDKRWARQTSKCESGGDPIAFPYKTQAVVAVALKNRDGAQHWPVCG